MRGLTLFELITASIQSGSKQLQEMENLLQEAERCLQFEKKGTFEFSIQNKVNYLLSCCNK